MKTRILTAFTVSALLLTSLAAGASTDDKWIHIKVDGRDDEQVTVNLPLSLLSAASAMIPDEVQHEIDREARIALDDLELTWSDLRTFWEELKNAPEATFVSVQTRDETIEVKKEGRFLLVNTPRTSDRGAEINVKFPLAVVDALLSGPEGTLNFQAALHELASYESESLVSVRDGDETVRIWIDRNNQAD